MARGLERLSEVGRERAGIHPLSGAAAVQYFAQASADPRANRRHQAMRSPHWRVTWTKSTGLERLVYWQGRRRGTIAPLDVGAALPEEAGARDRDSRSYLLKNPITSNRITAPITALTIAAM